MNYPFKILVDSRSAALGHGGSFSISLPETIHLKEDTALYVNNVTLTNSFLTTGSTVGHKSHYFYWFEKMGNNMVFNRATLSERSYDVTELASELQTRLNQATWFGDDLYTCTYNESKQTITISRPVGDGSRSFFVPDETLLSNPAVQAQTNPMTVGSVPYVVDWMNLQSANGKFGLGKGSSVGLDILAFYPLIAGSLYTQQETGAVDARRAHSVYVHSQALSNQNVIGVAGSRSTICKIPVINTMGDVLHQPHNGHIYDFVDVSNRTLSVLDFEIKDDEGNSLDLRGGTMSLELLFTARPF